MRQFTTTMTTCLLWLALCCGDTSGQEISLSATKKVVVEKEVAVEKGQILTAADFPLRARAPQGGILYQWQYPTGVVANKKSSVLEIVSAPKGINIISVTYAVVDFDNKTVKEMYVESTIQVGDGPDPGPTPDPDPPKPDPTPPAPIPVAGFRVLIIEESADRAKLPPSQLSVIFSEELAKYLNAKTVSEGKYAGWGVFDKDIDTSKLPKTFQDALARPRTSLPWLIVSNGKSGYEGPLPTTITETMAILKKYGE